MSDLNELAVEFMRGEVRKALDQCTPKQQAFFAKLYPEGVGKIPSRKLATAHDQCLRTIEKNRRQAAPEGEGQEGGSGE